MLIGHGFYPIFAMSFELAFQRHRFEVNQHLVAEVMHVLLKSGQSASREEAVEKKNVHPYEYQKQQGDRALTSRATGFGTRDP
ncbi:hypothetical protein DY000_02031313 [Brassica cretica]|uniref:Uncharacterized protein n=1 Tax=Brassica cretica TaxID=69181 RepID=A0ABQ7DSU4_BRACR|nr:hypothetical protein DY000_02031313 [Brassica cretica]